MLYTHIVQYYETDKMGITHHSNYVRWMEEARVAYLADVGWDFAKLESLGVVSPVVSVNVRYIKTTTFSDVVTVDVGVDEFKGVKLRMKYFMKNEQGEIVCEAYSEHCFLNKGGTPIRLKKALPEFYEILTNAATTD